MPLKILVTAKRVEDPESKIRFARTGAGSSRRGSSYKINPFDEIAVEEALRLKERHGGEVVVVSVGVRKVPDRAARCHGHGRQSGRPGSPRRAARPPDRLGAPRQGGRGGEARPGPPREAVHRRRPGPDRPVPGRAARLAPGHLRLEDRVARERGREEAPEPGMSSRPTARAHVVREVDGGSSCWRSALPAVATTELRLNKPRFASLPGIMKAKKKPLQEIPAASLGVGSTPRVVILPPLRARRPQGRASRSRTWTSCGRKLHEEAKVL